MKRHAIIRWLAAGLIAAQLAVLAVAALSSRKEPIDAVVVLPGSYQERGEGRGAELPVGKRLEVVPNRFFWERGEGWKVVGEDYRVSPGSLIAEPFTRRWVNAAGEGAVVRAEPSASGAVLRRVPLGASVEVVEAELLSGVPLESALQGHEVVLEPSGEFGFVARSQVRISTPTADEWVSAAERALEQGQLAEAVEHASKVSGDSKPFATALAAALIREQRHVPGATLHPVRLPQLPASGPLPAYSLTQVREAITHLHDGAVTSRWWLRPRLAGEPPSRAYVAVRELPLYLQPDAARPIASVLPANSELQVLETFATWARVSVAAPPAPDLVEVDFAAPAAEQQVRITPGRKLPATIAGLVDVRGLSLAPLDPQAVRALTIANPDAVEDASSIPTRGRLDERLRAGFETRDADRIAQAAVAREGDGYLGGTLLDAEVLSECAVDADGHLGCVAACGEPLVSALPEARAHPQPKAGVRYLYLRVADAPPGPLDLSVTVEPCRGGDPDVRGFTLEHPSAAPLDIWIKLEGPLPRSVAIVEARPEQATPSAYARRLDLGTACEAAPPVATGKQY